jgi:hypothetical protein
LTIFYDTNFFLWKATGNQIKILCCTRSTVVQWTTSLLKNSFACRDWFIIWNFFDLYLYHKIFHTKSMINFMDYNFFVLATVNVKSEYLENMCSLHWTMQCVLDTCRNRLSLLRSGVNCLRSHLSPLESLYITLVTCLRVKEIFFYNIYCRSLKNFIHTLKMYSERRNSHSSTSLNT